MDTEPCVGSELADSSDTVDNAELSVELGGSDVEKTPVEVLAGVNSLICVVDGSDMEDGVADKERIS